MLEPGDKIPKLKGTLQDGSTLRVADLLGKPFVLYFYPKDMTQGCTLEAQDFRDFYPKFKKAGAEIVGVSRDDVVSHDKFRLKHNLPFPLLADTDETWCRAFDVIGEKMLYGKSHIGVIRSTFLIDAEGRIVEEWRGVRVPGHALKVLERLTRK
ncbi:MAG TPA: peroxiredoxin [Rhodanobacteraceae bacterium]|nr:peroxiredoxin [Rhodanobacteraceae bacterium]